VECLIVANKRAAEEHILAAQEKRERPPASTATTLLAEEAVLPVIIKASTGGGLEAVEQEVRKHETAQVRVKIISRGVGTINESDLKSARVGGEPVIVGFNVGIDPPARGIIERGGATVKTFDVIYKLSEWVAERVKERTPKVTTTTITASARILKIFTAEKDRQVVGGKVVEGELKAGDEFKILRRDALVGNGRVRELQRFKEKISSAAKDSEFGAYVSTSVSLMQGDRIEAVTTTQS
jgi:translation initiation factor IF-2